ncbi:MAG: endonuclease/exonuclease/phosphatase family protein [Rubricoccaceae bacterium]
MRAVLGLVVLLLSWSASAQTIPPRGDAGALDVASWNIEWFAHPVNGPSDDSLQVRNVRAIVRQAGLDVWALQEIASVNDFFRLVGDLVPSGFNGVIGPQTGSADADQRLAYVYRSDAVQVRSVRTILPGESFNFAGRLPLELRANVTVGDVTEEVYFINFHAKAFSGTQDYNRRLGAAQALKAYTDALVEAGARVVILGDYNDRLRISTAAGRPSPYLAFVDDPRYRFATDALDLANTPTFCGNTTCTSGSAIDHIAYTEALFAAYVEGSGDRYAELVAAVPSYRSTTSDHLPVLARFRLGGAVSAEDAPAGAALGLRLDGPNPFRTGTALAFSLAEAADVRLEVFDALGRRVAVVTEGARGAGTHRVHLDAAALAPGSYVARLVAGGQAEALRLVRVR